MTPQEDLGTRKETGPTQAGGAQSQLPDVAALNKLLANIEQLVQMLLRQTAKDPAPTLAAETAGKDSGLRTSAAGPGGTRGEADRRPPAPSDGKGRIGARRPQYMIQPRSAPGFQLLSADLITQYLSTSPDVSIVKTIEPPRLLGLQSLDGPTLGPLILARMAAENAKNLQSRAGPQLTVERDLPLTFALDPVPVETRLPNPGVLVPHADGFSVTFDVTSESGRLPEAEVFVFGSAWPTQAVTDAAGRVTMSIVGESPDTIAALYVKPKVDHWDFWLDRPQLTPSSVNTVTVKPLGGYLRDFPGRQLVGWGERAMGLDRVPASYDGAGIKVAVIDSGAAQTHRNLHNVGPGVSVIGNDRGAWTVDTIGHGSHCAGIIGGGPVGTGSGIRGFAPAAEIHVIRIFPGGRFSDLVAAIDYCMENGIDVANMSLGGGEPSRILEERIMRAKEMGMACIAAAGNSAGPVQFPASTPHVLAVAALGKFGEFPEESFHARQVLDGFPKSRDGYFPAKFSCFGPEVDVCAPGVAIVSSLPADGFGAWDGTSMAAPHVTGLAALILAHHPDFKGPFQNKDARRVERLFQIIKASATPLQFGDPNRTGAGLPNALRALGLEAAGPSTAAQPVPEASMEALRRLLAILAGSSGATQPLGTGVVPPVMMPSTSLSAAYAVPRGPARTTSDYSLALHQLIPGASFGRSN